MSIRRQTWIAALACVACLAGIGARAEATTGRNPLAPRSSWGVDPGSVLADYVRDHPGTEWARQIANEARQPLTKWFTATNVKPYAAVRNYIARVASAHPGEPTPRTFLADFRLPTHEQCDDKTSAAAIRSYEAWQRQFAAGIGDAPATVLLEPDLPEVDCLPAGGRRRALALVRYAVTVLRRQPHVTIYLDAGAADYLSVRQAATLLRAAGVRHVRGFGLGLTHFDATRSEIRYGNAIVRRLGRVGGRYRHFVIDTVDNGRPRTRQSLTASERRCRASEVVLGQPPTTRTASRFADAYLWVGRPWLSYGGCKGSAPAHSFWPAQAAAIARRSPYL